MPYTRGNAREWAFVGGLIGVHVWAHLHWIWTNVTPLGYDSGGHLGRTLEMADVLTGLTPRTLFQALTLTDYRPPLLYILTQPFYWLFGVSMDAAQYLNVALFVLIAVLTYVIGRRAFDARTGWLAVALLAFWPLMAAMTRLFYMENLQTAMLLLIVWTLWRTEMFTSRRWSVAWGITLGVGMLAKWTVPPLAALPILWAMYRAGVWGALWKGVRRPRVAWRALVVAVGGALAITLVLYLPNRDLVAQLPLGDWLAVAWFVLWAGAFYALALPSSPVANAVGGLLVGAAIASIWYLGRIDFLDRLIFVAFETEGGRFEPFNPLRLRNYTRYFGYLVRAHWGLLGTMVLAPVVLWRWGREGRRLSADALGIRLLLLTLLSGYLALSLPSQEGVRNLVPLLPVLALLAAGALHGWPRQRAWSVALVWLVVFGVQWAMVTFDSAAAWRAMLPPVWAESDAAQPPASGLTDPGYWIAPDVLTTMTTSTPDVDPLVFGMLISMPNLNRGHYRYLIRTTYPQVELLALTDDGRGGWPWAVRSLWLLTKDGDNHDVESEGQRILREVYDNPDGLFSLIFEAYKTYPLPNGETATLWRRTRGHLVMPKFRPSPETAPVGAQLAAWLNRHPLMLSTREHGIWLAVALDIAPERVLLPDASREEADTLFTLLTPGQEQGIVWLMRDYAPVHTAWLDVGGMWSVWQIWARLDFDRAAMPLDAVVGDVRLRSWRVPTSRRAGEAVPLLLDWQGTVEGVRASFRLLADDGRVLAQRDTDLNAAPVRSGFFVPPNVPPGLYKVGVVLYDAQSGQPLDVEQPLVELGTVRIEANMGERAEHDGRENDADQQ
nr:glycosyltransferase family 39 protein [Ardenticatena sp.]